MWLFMWSGTHSSHNDLYFTRLLPLNVRRQSNEVYLSLKLGDTYYVSKVYLTSLLKRRSLERLPPIQYLFASRSIPAFSRASSVAKSCLKFSELLPRHIRIHSKSAENSPESPWNILNSGSRGDSSTPCSDQDVRYPNVDPDPLGLIWFLISLFIWNCASFPLH